MFHDAHSLTISTSSAEAVAAFDRTINGYLKYRADTAEHLGRTIAADPEFGLAHCVKGYFTMLSYKQANVPIVAEAARTARQHATKATVREQKHVAALEAWIAGDLNRMLSIWESIRKLFYERRRWQRAAGNKNSYSKNLLRALGQCSGNSEE